MPRDLGSEAWYKETATAVQHYRDLALRLEDAELEKARKPFLEQLVVELEALKSAAASECVQGTLAGEGGIRGACGCGGRRRGCDD